MTRLTHREAAEAVLAGKGLTWQDGEPAKNGAIDMRISMLDRLSDYYLAAPTPQPTEAPMPWTPETNRIQTWHLKPTEISALADAKHGLLVWNDATGWQDLVGYPFWAGKDTYRAKPAPAPTLSITVNGVTNVVAAGVTEALAYGQTYWVVCLNVPEFCTQNIWRGITDFTKEWLERGLVHLTEAAARAHAMALVGLKAEGVL